MTNNQAGFDAKMPDAVVAEYNAMRSEILKRIELRYQIINYALVIAGVLFGFGFQNGKALAFLAYPPLALLLCWMWADNGKIIMAIGAYIRDEIEIKAFGGRGIGWEIHVGRTSTTTASPMDIPFAGGTFVTVQLISIGLASLLYGDYSSQFLGLLLFDVGVVCLTIWFLKRQGDLLHSHLAHAIEKSKKVPRDGAAA